MAGGGGMNGEGHAWQGACVVGGHAWQGACQGVCMAGGMHDGWVHGRGHA